MLRLQPEARSPKPPPSCLIFPKIGLTHLFINIRLFTSPSRGSFGWPRAIYVGEQWSHEKESVMSDVTLTILDLDRAIHGRMQAADVERTIAALAAEPETIEELDRAIDRFTGDEGRTHFSGFVAGQSDEPASGGVVVIDLAARRIAGESSVVTIAREGNARDALGDHLVSYRLGDHWEAVASMEQWEERAGERRQEHRYRGGDPREVLYGRPMLRYLHDVMTMMFDSQDPDEAITQVHAQWLTKARADLGGRSPREVLLERCDAIMHDIASREHQWSARGSCPPGLERTSAAYQYAGFGTHEIVVYYDLVRHLLSAWRRWDERRDYPESDDRIEQLEKLRDAWLEQANEEYEGRTPAAVIDKERRRLPEGMSGADAAIDCDCPICQMMAEDSQTYFWGLDGASMDDDFAFSFHLNREDWEAEQQKWAELDREIAAGPLAAPDDRFLQNGVWQRCFFSDHRGEEMGLAEFVPVATFGFAAMIGELNQDIREIESNASEASTQVQTLNRLLGNLREALSGTPELIDPTLERLVDELAELAESYPSLTDKCQDLSRRLEEFPDQLAASAARS